jgi:hypothetical protein
VVYAHSGGIEPWKLTSGAVRVEAHNGTVEAHIGAVEAHGRAVEAHNGAVEAHSRAVEARPGLISLEARPGSTSQ